MDELTVDFLLIKNGMIDSLGLFMLVAFVDERFGIPLGYGELNPEGLRDDRGDRQVDRAKSGLGQLLA